MSKNVSGKVMIKLSEMSTIVTILWREYWLCKEKGYDYLAEEYKNMIDEYVEKLYSTEYWGKRLGEVE